MSNNLSAEYYQDNKEKLQKKVCERYQSFSKKDKKKKNQEYGHERYKNLAEN